MISTQVMSELIFFSPIMVLLVLDLYLHKKHPEQSLKQAMIWTVLWISLAMLFNGYVFWSMGQKHALDFLTGYIVEMSLSVDNLFVIMMIFSFFAVPKRSQHRVLFWGIFGAFVMRGFFIWAGVSLIQTLHAAIYVFGAFLIITGIKTATEHKETVDLSQNKVVTLVKKMIPITNDYHGSAFLIRVGGKLMGTPLLLALIVVEASDLIFAVDSIPAILGITTNSFIVITSNLFAILGLRSMYFVLNHFLAYFHLLRYGLGVILCFVGTKMVISDWVHVPVFITLLVIFGTLTVTALLSIVIPKKELNT